MNLGLQFVANVIFAASFGSPLAPGVQAAEQCVSHCRQGRSNLDGVCLDVGGRDARSGRGGEVCLFQRCSPFCLVEAGRIPLDTGLGRRVHVSRVWRRGPRPGWQAEGDEGVIRRLAEEVVKPPRDGHGEPGCCIRWDECVIDL